MRNALYRRIGARPQSGRPTVALFGASHLRTVAGCARLGRCRRGSAPERVWTAGGRGRTCACFACEKRRRDSRKRAAWVMPAWIAAVPQSWCWSRSTCGRPPEAHNPPPVAQQTSPSSRPSRPDRRTAGCAQGGRLDTQVRASTGVGPVSRGRGSCSAAGPNAKNIRPERHDWNVRPPRARPSRSDVKALTRSESGT